MKIVIPNAKELNTNLDSQAFQGLPAASQELLKVLLTLTPAELADFYKIKAEKAEQEADRWKRIADAQAKLYSAWQLYDGLMYRYMQRKSLSDEETAYLREHVFITTGFYGAINVFDWIAPHRLDFQGKLLVNHQSLKQFWRAQYDALVAEDDLIISLLSAEFEAVFSPAVQKKMIKITFMEERNGQRKIHSTISKKGRGRLVSVMAQKNVQSIKEIKLLEFDGFRYASDLSSEKEVVFVRKAPNL